MNSLNFYDAVQKYRKGSTREMDILICQISDPAVKDDLIIYFLMHLREHVSELGQDFEYIIGAILKVNWIFRSAAVVNEYQNFIINLVSAQTIYLKPIIKSFVKLFIPVLTAEEKAAMGTVCQQRRTLYDQAFRNVHMTLSAICKLVPMAPSILIPILSDCYPYFSKDAYIHECYVRNLIHITLYLPNSRKQILQLAVVKMLELDVRSSRADIMQAEIDNEEEVDEMLGHQDDMFDMDDHPASQFKSNDEDKQMAHITANKLDILLNLFMVYTKRTCYPDDKLDWSATKSLYKELLFVFDSVIIQVHSCCHVQFIMFYICSFHSELSGAFIDYLWKKFKNPNTQPVLRQASVAYLSNFVARAVYVTPRTALDTMQILAEWLHTYIKQTAYSSSAADIVHHGPFYSVCQSLFYIFIFRNREILELGDGFKITQSINFQAIVTCRLNPLRVILPVIVKTFSSLTRMHQLAFCDTVIEHNNRCVLPVTSLTDSQQSTVSVNNQLDSFFPFDPFLLERSKNVVEPLYQNFHGGLIETAEKPVNEEEDDFLDQIGSSVKSNGDLHAAKSPMDFLSFEASPGFKHMYKDLELPHKLHDDIF